MPCENCNVQFTVFKRKKSCSECRRLYCKDCLVKNKDKSFCDRCVILTRRPISKKDLFKLKPKDLIFYLQSKHISTRGCVEKEELVNLVLAHINSGNYYSSAGDPLNNDDGDNVSNSFDQIKQTCQNLFSSITEKITDLQKNTDTRPSSSNSRNTTRVTNITTQPRSGTRPDSTSNLSSNNTFVNFREAQSNSNGQLPQNSREEVTSFNANKSPVSSSTTTTSRRTSNTNSLSSSILTSPTNSGFSFADENNCKVIPNNSNNIPSVHIKSKLKQTTLLDHCGCECSSDDVHTSNISHTKRKSRSEIHLLHDENQPGPSGITSKTTVDINMSPERNVGTTKSDTNPLPKLDETDSSSSFEEIVAISPNIRGDRENVIKIRKVTRTKSDTCITNASSKFTFLNGFRNDNITEDEDDDENDGNNQNNEMRKRKKCCSRCGKTKLGIKRKILKFRKQLEKSNISEAEKKRQLDEFLSYLEQKSLNSQHDDLTDTESNTENDVNVTNAIDDDDMTEDENAGIYVYPSGDITNENELDAREDYSKRISDLINNKSIQLHDIQSSDDLESLTVKQLKQILVLNRVDFKGCVEKNELKERVLRLWKDHASGPSIDKLQVDDLCKICMDAPIECVILECGHMATCTNCGKVLSECPICRQYIVRVVRFFKA